MLDPVAQAQVLNYLKASSLSVGLVLHFGPRPVVKRVVRSRYYSRLGTARLSDETPVSMAEGSTTSSRLSDRTADGTTNAEYAENGTLRTLKPIRNSVSLFLSVFSVACVCVLSVRGSVGCPVAHLVPDHQIRRLMALADCPIAELCQAARSIWRGPMILPVRSCSG